MSISLFGGCTRNRYFSTDYFRVWLNYREGRATILGLTDLGREQEILAIPMFVEGLTVRQIGRYPRLNVLGLEASADFRSPYLVKLYIPHTVDIVKAIYTTYFCEIEMKTIDNDVKIVTMRVGEIGNLIYESSNVVFKYNYNNAPNQGYYWFDYVTGSNLYLIPPPTRQGYAFDGWYLDSRGTTPWNNQMPQSAEENLRLYAKWQRV